MDFGGLLSASSLKLQMPRLKTEQNLAARLEVVERFARAKCSDLGGAEARKSEHVGVLYFL